MVASNMCAWMAMFAIDLTSVPADDVVTRSKVVDEYKQSAIDYAIKKLAPPIDIDDDGSEVGADWTEPAEPVGIESTILNEDNSWFEPNDVINIDGGEATPHGVWVDPTVWGD